MILAVIVEVSSSIKIKNKVTFITAVTVAHKEVKCLLGNERAHRSILSITGRNYDFSKNIY